MDPEEPETVFATVTCHTPGCANGEIALDDVLVIDVPNPPVICGVCEQWITDIVKREG